MRKKLTAILIALTIMVSLLPVPAMAAVSESEEAVIRERVSKIVTDYAKSVYSPTSDDDAFNKFFKHGFFGNGKDMPLAENGPMVSALFNSCLMQESLIIGITKSIVMMQDLKLDSIFVSGGPSWHDFGYNIGLFGYLNEQCNPEDFLGYPRYASYKGDKNENDTVMELLAGWCSTHYTITEVERKNGTVVYNIALDVHDTFDFNSDYDHLKKYGMDTSKDQDLVNLGFLLTFVGLTEFYWSFQKSFQVEVPIRCDHGIYNYHWTFDGPSHSMISEDGNGFQSNPAADTFSIYKDADGVEQERHYFGLQESVVLRHDRPWVLELDQTGNRGFQFGPRRSNQGGVFPTILVTPTHYVQLYTHEEWHSEEDNTITYAKHYVGANFNGAYKYYSTHSYTFAIENKVHADGSNMPYLTVTDNDLGKIVFGPEPMDDHWIKKEGEDSSVLTDTSSDHFVGTDIILNYLGNSSLGIYSESTVMDLRVWENGKNAAPEQGDYIAPTCTEQGGTRFECNKCGKEYFTNVEPALGHDFGAYISDNNAACLTDGTETRSCTRCGLKDTRTVSGSALGHDFGEYVYDENAACLTDGTKTRACSRCDVTESIPAEGTALGHDFGKFVSDGNATCTDNGTKTRACTRCDAKESATDIGTAKGHSYTPAVTAPTCTEGGYTTYTCHCGDSYIAEETAPAGHTEVEDPAVPATCISSGKKAGSHCSVCGVVTKEQELIPIGNHSWDAGTVIKQPTLSEMGTLMYTCIHCDSKNYMSMDKLPTLGFSDVPADAYYATPVAWAKNKGITSGLSDTLFGSDMSCTRGQVVTFLWAAAGRPEPTGSDNPFTDVYASDYYYKPVLWAVEQGITGGIGDGLFGPHQECTRGQIVTFLWRAMNSPEPAGENTFTDVTETDWFARPVLWASENAITGGIGNNQFGPYQECTRAQVVTFLYKVYN